MGTLQSMVKAVKIMKVLGNSKIVFIKSGTLFKIEIINTKQCENKISVRRKLRRVKIYKYCYIAYLYDNH